MNNVLSLRTCNESLEWVKQPVITSGNEKIDKLQVEFGPEWDFEGAKYHASFFLDDPEKTIDVELDDDFSCDIPIQMLLKPGVFHFGVWCETDGEEVKSSEIKCFVLLHGIKPTNNAGWWEGVPDVPYNLGIYVGTGEMPRGYNVQIDPDGDVIVVPTKLSELENDMGYITKDKEIVNVEIRDYFPDGDGDFSLDSAEGKALRFTFGDGTYKDVPLPEIFSKDISIEETDEAIIITCIAGNEIRSFEIPKNSPGLDSDGGEVEILPASELYVTPQMFGAAADGVADDTEAVQTALNQGGVIYFPAGVYKVTRQLTTTKPCVIKMFKQYPSRYWRSDNTSGRYDYPIIIDEGETDYETDKGYDLGARIECYPSEGEQYGLLIGDGCEIDGLFLRAMNGFNGVLLKYDNLHQYGTDNIGDPITYSSYPSAMRFKHIRLDCDRHNDTTTIPEAMFDFYPKNKYFYILDDIVIGQNREYAEYGFRSIVDPESATWANSVRITNLCLNILAEYPLYIANNSGTHAFTNWIFEGMSIQTFPFTDTEFEQNLSGHKAVVTLKNMSYVLFSGCYIWDLLRGSGETAKYIKVFDCENLSNVSCVGCSEEFYNGTRYFLGDSGEDGIETVLKGRLQAVAEDVNFKTATMSTTILQDGSNRIILTDNHGNEKYVDIPPVSLSDEQLSSGIGNWMDDNALPKEEIGKNKFNAYSEENLEGSIYGSTGIAYEQVGGGSLASHYIPAKFGDEIRLGFKGTNCQWSRIYMYDKDYKYLGYLQYTDPSVVDRVGIVNFEDTAYIRFLLNFQGKDVGGEGYEYSKVPDLNLCLTINNPDVSYEPYRTVLVGGLSQYFSLQSPNGTKYSVAVLDDGTIVAKDSEDNVIMPNYDERLNSIEEMLKDVETLIDESGVLDDVVDDVMDE